MEKRDFELKCKLDFEKADKEKQMIKDKRMSYM